MWSHDDALIRPDGFRRDIARLNSYIRHKTFDAGVACQLESWLQ